MLEKIKYGKKLGDFNEQFVDEWISELHKYKRHMYFKQGRLFLEDTEEFIWYYGVTEDDQIETIYEVYRNDCWTVANSFYQLDKHEKESIIWDSMYIVNKKYNIIVDNFDSLLPTIIQTKCIDLVRSKERLKRGGKDIPKSLDNEDEYEEPGEIDYGYEEMELKIYIQQMSIHFTKKEYKYLQLIISTPFRLSNVEAANILGMSEGGIRKLKKSLQSKLIDLKTNF